MHVEPLNREHIRRFIIIILSDERTGDKLKNDRARDSRPFTGGRGRRLTVDRKKTRTKEPRENRTGLVISCLPPVMPPLKHFWPPLFSPPPNGRELLIIHARGNRTRQRLSCWQFHIVFCSFLQPVKSNRNVQLTS